MAEATDLQLSITANVDGLKVGLSQAQASVKGAAQSMQGDLGRATQGASRGFGGLSDALRAYGREQREQGRNARLLANEITSILPASNATAQGLAGVAASLVGGFGILAAFDLLKIGIQAYRDYQARALEEAKKFAKEGLDAITEAANRAKSAIGDVWGSMGGSPATANVGRAQIAYMRRQRAGLQAKLDSTEDDDQRKELQKAIDEADKQIVQTELAIPGAAFRDRVKFEEDQRRKSEAAAKKAEEAAKHAKAEREKLEAILAGGRPMDQKPLGLDNWAEGVAAENGRDARAQVAKGQGATDFSGVFAANQVGDEFLSSFQKDFVTDAKAEAAGAGKSIGDSLVEPMVSAWTNGLTSMLTRQQSFAQGVAGIFTGMMQIVVQMAMKQILASAAVSGAEAAKSQAGIPVVGPILAISAMSAMLAQVSAMTSKVPSAAGGWKVPYDTLAMVHEDERILPARYSQGLDRLVNEAASGRAAGGMTVNVAALDGTSVYRTLTARDGDVARAMKRMQRRRRA